MQRGDVGPRSGAKCFLSKNLDIAVFFGILTVNIAIKRGNKMTRNEVLYKVIEIVNEHKGYNFPKATENSRLAEDLGMDSLDIVETGMDIERRLDIVFDTDEFEEVKFNLKSVKDMVNFTCKKLNIPVIDVQKNVEKTVIKPVQPQNPEIEKLKTVDLSKLAGKPVQLGGYEVIVRKIAETQQNKR